MKGWRPSAKPKARPRIGLLKRTYSCRTSDRSACLFPWGSVSWLFTGDAPRTTKFPRVTAQSGSRPPGRAEMAPKRLTRTRIRDCKGASPSLARETGGIRKEMEEGLLVCGCSRLWIQSLDQDDLLAQIRHCERKRSNPCEHRAPYGSWIASSLRSSQ
jgi:hypothetical protein